MTAPVLSVNTSQGRFYKNPRTDKQVPSITNIIGMKDKPALKYWAARQAATFAADNLETMKRLKRDEVIDLVRGAPFRRTDASSNVGDILHGWIDDFTKVRIISKPDSWVPLDYDKAPKTAQRMWKQFVAIVEKYEPELLYNEVTVWSDTHDYAGTVDWIWKINGAIVFGDTKTGNAVYPEVGMQVGAGNGADYAIGMDGEQFKLPDAERFAALHIRPTYARLSPLNGVDECFKAFLHLRGVHRWMCETSEEVIGYAPKIQAQE